MKHKQNVIPMAVRRAPRPQIERHEMRVKWPHIAAALAGAAIWAAFFIAIGAML